jgi:hypothetical protein
MLLFFTIEKSQIISGTHAVTMAQYYKNFFVCNISARNKLEYLSWASFPSLV